MRGVIQVEPVDSKEPASESTLTASSVASLPSVQVVTSSKPKETLPQPTVSEEAKPTLPETEAPKEDIRSMQLTVGTKTFSATLADNDAARAFVELMRNAPVVIHLSDYSGFEKVGSLGSSLPTSNGNITASEGDILLYNGNQIVVFYGSNSWSYTRLGKIDDLSGWKEALGSGEVTITFSIV